LGPAELPVSEAKVYGVRTPSNVDDSTLVAGVRASPGAMLVP
jgi:hypothetical protein